MFAVGAQHNYLDGVVLGGSLPCLIESDQQLPILCIGELGAVQRDRRDGLGDFILDEFFAAGSHFVSFSRRAMGAVADTGVI